MTSSSCTPSTAIARWSSANASIPQLARTITTNLSGVGAGRRAVQIRPFRLQPQPAKAADGSTAKGGKKDEGRNLFVVRALSTGEQVMVFVEDKAAQPRVEQLAQAASSKGKEKAADQTVTDKEDDDMVIVDLPTADNASDSSSSNAEPAVHSRWSYISLGSTSTGSAAPPFDTFLQRVLSGNGAAANNPMAGAWTPRTTAVSLEGFVFSVGGTPGTVGDWEIRVEQVMPKGGAAGGTSRGLLVEATYLAVPYLPPRSTFVKDFLTALFPPQAIASGEVEFVDVPEEEFIEAGLLKPRSTVAGEEDDDGWEWTDKHSCFAYVHTFKKEGLL